MFLTRAGVHEMGRIGSNDALEKSDKRHSALAGHGLGDFFFARKTFVDQD